MERTAPILVAVTALWVAGVACAADGPTQSHPMWDAPEPAVTCDDLVAFEPAAVLGRLIEPQLTCLEGRYATGDPVVQERISDLLIANAFGTGEMPKWAALVERHLDLHYATAPDPDVPYKFALWLGKKAPARNEDIVRLCEAALADRGLWFGDTVPRKVTSLYEMRAQAAERLWEEAEAQLARAPGKPAKTLARAAKDRTRAYAEEWHAAAVAMGRDTSAAEALCTLVAAACAP